MYENKLVREGGDGNEIREKKRGRWPINPRIDRNGWRRMVKQFQKFEWQVTIGHVRFAGSLRA